jgi:hypothetical protein
MSLLDPAVAPSPSAAATGTAAGAPASARRQRLPLLLYLPGVDGTGLAAARQFPSLLQKFDMRTLVTPVAVSAWQRAGLEQAILFQGVDALVLQ